MFPVCDSQQKWLGKGERILFVGVSTLLRGLLLNLVFFSYWTLFPLESCFFSLKGENSEKHKFFI